MTKAHLKLTITGGSGYAYFSSSSPQHSITKLNHSGELIWYFDDGNHTVWIDGLNPAGGNSHLELDCNGRQQQKTISNEGPYSTHFDFSISAA